MDTTRDTSPALAVPAPAAARVWNGWWAAILLSLVYYALTVGAAWDKSPTGDEPIHLLGGYTYNRYGDFRLQPENGNLPQRLAGLPALWLSQRDPSLDGEAWRREQRPQLVYDWYYASGDVAHANDFRAMQRAGRMVIALLGLATVLLAYGWARSLFGRGGGLIAAILTAFSPNLLAHGGQTTSDMATAATFTATLWALSAVFRAPSPLRVALAGAALGAAALSKFSVVLFIPLIGLFVVAFAVLPEVVPLTIGVRVRAYDSFRKKFVVLAAAALAVILIAYGLIWAAFDFRYSAFNVGSTDPAFFTAKFDEAAAYLGATGKLLRLPLRLHLLPEAYYCGFLRVMKYAQLREAYLCGEYSDTGWPSFFILSTLLKTPLSTLLLWAAGAIASVAALRAAATPEARRRFAWFLPLLPIFAFVALYMATAVRSHLNIGHRHMLVVYPSMAVLAGSLAVIVRGLRRAGYFLAGLLLWTAVETLAWFPNYLPYFNSIVGHDGYRYFTESSVDWGQDLPAVAKWIARERSTPAGAAMPIYLGYFGYGLPAAEGITDVRQLSSPSGCLSGHIDPDPEPLRGGTYIVGATILSQVYSGPTRGHWNPAYEAAYQYLAGVAAGRHGRADILAALGDDAPVFEHLRSARLCAYLRVRRTPDEILNGSTLIYRLTDADVRDATGGPPPESRASEGNYVQRYPRLVPKGMDGDPTR